MAVVYILKCASRERATAVDSVVHSIVSLDVVVDVANKKDTNGNQSRRWRSENFTKHDSANEGESVSL